MSTVDAAAGPQEGGGGVARAVAQFALSGLLALVVLGFAGVYLLRHKGQSEAIRNAKQVTAVAGYGIVEPNVTVGLARGERAAIARLDRVVRRGILGERVVRVKIWRPDGRILYSDVHRLIGTTYTSGADERRLLRIGGIDASVSNLDLPENRFERRYGKLLEVYMPIADPAGRPLMFETYERYSSIAASSRRLWRAFAPAILGTLALLWLVQLPLALRAARRLRDGQLQRELLLRHAIDASELERKRIARDLHDGAVQDLAGVSYTLAAAADRAASVPAPETALTLREAAAGTRRTIRQLRSLLVDIYPADLHRVGLAAALHDLVAPLGPRGIEATVEAPDDLKLNAAAESLLYRAAQEAIRNVVTHSDAKQASIRLAEAASRMRLVVEDDGRGFDSGAGEGHLGLKLLADLAREARGTFTIESVPGRGTRMTIEVPPK
jgi:two-component system NarL family sensor kinase